MYPRALSFIHDGKSAVMRALADFLQAVALTLGNAGDVFFLGVCHELAPEGRDIDEL